MFNSLAATTVRDSGNDHGAQASDPMMIVDATRAGDHVVFWVASAVAALMFRSGPLPIDTDSDTLEAR
ncbi:hypothetical protein [Rhodococcus sp. APC 3903]|uniref:hypothetical protein n=1 Tax=Rhodococcus sp. APC 3903 TaxID=3035193 RepID=UPI0025B44C4D|nr:hypothetical protein [Rhodococcus sp. APC 3903]MDN3460109.1 hypothetical protein [Rhodococcus sp. APC 3903]